MFYPRILFKILYFASAIFILMVLFHMLPVNDDFETWEIQNEEKLCPKNSSFMATLDSDYCVNESQIFLVETSGSKDLNIRQACSVESASRHHPSLTVRVLMTCNEPIDFHDVLMSSLVHMPNVQVLRVDVPKLVRGTPIWNWYRKGKWLKSTWKVSHLSDALRYFLMSKYGGMYLDMDIVVLRPMTKLRNAVITEDWNRIAAGILVFDRNHTLMRKSMFDFTANYNPNNFVENGPGVITRNLKEFCDIEDVSKVSGAECGVSVLPPEAAFPITYDKWEKYFTPTNVGNITAKFNNSYLIHVWNKFSKVRRLKVGSNSLYELAIREHCPRVYEHAKRIGFV